jgi:hypothetical protein
MSEHFDHGGPEETPSALREGVREGIVAALEREDRQRGTWAARRLAAAGGAGVAAAVLLSVLFAGETSGSGREWHLAICGAVWAGLLVEGFAFVFLRIRTPRIQLGQAAALGLIGVGLAALVVLFCPDPHFFRWWQSTSAGQSAATAGGTMASAFCLGLCSAVFLGFSACLVLNWKGRRLTDALVPAVAFNLLLLPALVLQSIAAGFGVLLAWALGTAIGSYGGVAAAIALAPRANPAVE